MILNTPGLTVTGPVIENGQRFFKQTIKTVYLSQLFADLRYSVYYRLKGTSINCLCPLRDLKRVAARREPQQNGYSILKVHNAADACFRSRPTGLYGQPRLCVALSRQAISMASKARLDSELVVKPEGTSN